jgi:hypothetical protein
MTNGYCEKTSMFLETNVKFFNKEFKFQWTVQMNLNEKYFSNEV